MNKKTMTALVPAAFAFLIGMSGCASDISNDRTHTPITGVKPVLFKPVFEIGEKKIAGEGEAGGFFNFDCCFALFDFYVSIPKSLFSGADGASNSAAYVEPSLYEGLTPTQAEALREAIFNACETNKAEYLVMPHFKIRTRSFPLLSFIWSKSYCSIYGIPANVKSVVPMDVEEAKAEVNLHVSATKNADVSVK